MSDKFQYRVVAGKHKNDDGSIVRAGEIILLTPERAARFVGKFERVTIPDPSPEITSPEVTEEEE